MLILLEINEVPFRVWEYLAQREPIIARFLRESELRLTQSPDQPLHEDASFLHPWVTWASLHRGVPNTVHGIGDLGQDLQAINAQYPPLWEQLHRAGKRVGVFGAMHSSTMPKEAKDYAFFVPDVFASHTKTFPKHLESFQALNLFFTQKSVRNVSGEIPLLQLQRFLMDASKWGVRPRTALKIASQILVEQLSPWKRTRRRTTQFELSTDVFFKLLKTHKPEFASFFTNHLASTMHRYWAATFPEDFEVMEFSAEWQRQYAGEIAFAGKALAQFLGRIMNFAARENYAILALSSMGQVARRAEVLETELFLENYSLFFAFSGLSTEDYEARPAMHPQYNFWIAPEKRALLVQKLEALCLCEKPFQFRQYPDGVFSLDFGHRNVANPTATFQGKNVEIQALGVKNKKIKDQSPGTAYHHPEGSYLFWQPQQRKGKDLRHEKPRLTTELRDEILRKMGV
jgi:hypothetical protein